MEDDKVGLDLHEDKGKLNPLLIIFRVPHG